MQGTASLLAIFAVLAVPTSSLSLKAAEAEAKTWPTADLSPKEINYAEEVGAKDAEAEAHAKADQVTREDPRTSEPRLAGRLAPVLSKAEGEADAIVEDVRRQDPDMGELRLSDRLARGSSRTTMPRFAWNAFAKTTNVLDDLWDVGSQVVALVKGDPAEEIWIKGKIWNFIARAKEYPAEEMTIKDKIWEMGRELCEKKGWPDTPQCDKFRSPGDVTAPETTPEPDPAAATPAPAPVPATTLAPASPPPAAAPATPLLAAAPADRDGDGHPDAMDAFPDLKSEWADSDGDGVGDNSDPWPHNPNCMHEGMPCGDKDRDGDGHPDEMDAFPDDKSEWADSDGDGVGDNNDPWPHNPSCFEPGLPCGEKEVTPTAPAPDQKFDPATLNKVERGLPSEGYDEYGMRSVEHDDGETYTGDWQNEWPSWNHETERESIDRICEDYPESYWCQSKERKWQFKR